MWKHLRQLASESLVYGLSGVVARFFNILLVPVYTRIFTPADYGVMSLVAATMTIVGILAVMALDNAAHRWFWDTEDLTDQKATLASWAWYQLAVAALLATLVYTMAEPLGQWIVGRGDAAVYFRLTAVTLPLSAFGGFVTNWLRMQRRAWATMGFSLATTLATIGLTLWLVVDLRWGLTGVYVAQLAGAALAAALAAALMRDWLHPRWFHRQRLREMLRYSLPLIPASLAIWIVGFSAPYFVNVFADKSEVGLYNVGNSLAACVALLTSAFQQAWGPFALSIHKRPDHRQVYAAVLLAYVWLTCLGSSAVAIFAPELLYVFTREQYYGAASVVAMLAFTYVVTGLGYIAVTGATLAKKTGPTGLAFLVAAVANLALNLLLGPPLGKMGAALAALGSQAIVPLYIFYRSQQLYPIPYRFGAAAALFALAAMLIVAARWVPCERMWLGALVKLGMLSVFVPALFLLRIVRPSQLAQVFRLSGRTAAQPVAAAPLPPTES